ncbi:hypothetical protein ES703_04175 [subsurface metagenome]|nr:phage tail tape measure protein [bacterium]
MAEFDFGAIFRLIDQASGPGQKIGSAFQTIKRAGDASVTTVSTLGERISSWGKKTLLMAGIMSSAFGQLSMQLDKMQGKFMAIEDAGAVLDTVLSPAERMSGGLRKAEKAAMSFAGETSIASDKYLSAVYQMKGVNLDLEASLAGANVSMKLAKATMADETEAAILLATTYTNLADKSKPVQAEMERLGDILGYTQMKFKFPSLAPLIEGMRKSTAAANTMGLPVEQAAVALGVLNSAGIEGAEAGTGMKRVLLTLGKTSEKLGFKLARASDGGLDLVGTLENLIAKYPELAAGGAISEELGTKLTQAFGLRGMPVVVSLIQQLDVFKQHLHGVAKATGVVDDAFARREKTWSATLAKMQNKFQSVIFTIFDAVPALKYVTAGFSILAKSITPFLTMGASMAIMIGALSKIHLMTKLCAAAQAIWNFITSLNPIFLIVTAVIALVAVFVILIKKSNKFRKLMLQVWQAIQKAVGFVLKGVGFLVRMYLQYLKIILTPIRLILKLFGVDLTGAMDKMIEKTKHWGDAMFDAADRTGGKIDEITDKIRTANAEQDKFIGRGVGGAGGVTAQTGGFWWGGKELGWQKTGPVTVGTRAAERFGGVPGADLMSKVKGAGGIGFAGRTFGTKAAPLGAEETVAGSTMPLAPIDTTTGGVGGAGAGGAPAIHVDQWLVRFAEGSIVMDGTMIGDEEEFARRVKEVLKSELEGRGYT